MMRSDCGLGEWIDAARSELPSLREGLRHMERDGNKEAATVLRLEIDLIRTILRRYTLLEHSDLAGTQAQLRLLESIHSEMMRVVQNPICRHQAPPLLHTSRALADIEELMRGIRGEAVIETQSSHSHERRSRGIK
jgi:hypothetical protein